RAIDNAHATAGELVQQFVIAEPVCAKAWAGGGCRRVGGRSNGRWLVELEEARRTETARGVGRQLHAAGGTGGLHGRHHRFTLIQRQNRKSVTGNLQWGRLPALRSATSGNAGGMNA